MTERIELFEADLVGFLKWRQGGVAVFEGRFGIVGAFDVGPEEAGELDDLAGGAELGICSLNRR